MPELTSVEELRQAIIDRYPELSKRLQQVGKHVIDHPNDFAIETLATISDRCGVQPSTIVRFAKEFDFDGASAMQRLFRNKLINDQSSLGYRERVRQLDAKAKDANAVQPIKSLFGEFVNTSVLALENLHETINARLLERAVKQIVKADTVFVAGFRRSFPVSSYLSYALGKAGKRVVLVDGVAGLHQEQIVACTQRDLLIATSFHPYSKEIIDVCHAAVDKKAKMLSITDSELSPLAQLANISMMVEDAEVNGFRSLSATLCLAQSIVVGYVYQTEIGA